MNKSLHHHLPGQCARNRRILSAGQQRNGKQRARTGHADDWAEQLVSVLNRRYIIVAAAIEDRRRHDQNGRVHKQRYGQRQRGVDVGHLNGLALARRRALVFAALHNRGVQV